MSLTIEQFEPATGLAAHCALAGLPFVVVNSRYSSAHEQSSDAELPRLRGVGVSAAGDKAHAWLKQAHSIDGHLEATQRALAPSVLSLVHGPLREVELWSAFSDERRYAHAFARAARAQLAWPMSMVVPSLLRQRSLARLRASGCLDDAWVQLLACEAYASLAALVGPLPLCGAPPAATACTAAAAQAPAAEAALALGPPGTPGCAALPAGVAGEPVRAGLPRTPAAPAVSSLQARLQAIATPFVKRVPSGAAEDDTEDAALAAAPAPGPSFSGPFLLGAHAPSSMDVALYAHLHSTCVRHGPPALWIARSAPSLIGYYHTMAAAVDEALGRLRDRGVDAGSPATGHGGARVNEFDALAGAIDRRCALQAAAEASGLAHRDSSAADGASARWGFDPALVHAASVDAAVAGRGPLKLLQDVVVTAGIFGAAIVLMRAVARSAGGAR